MSAPASATGGAGSDVLEEPRDQGLLRVVPAAAEVLLVVDLVQLRASPWTKDVLATAKEGRAERAAERGFDELAEVDEMLLASLPAAGAAPAEEGASLLVMRGRIDAGRALAAARARWPKAAETVFRGRTIVSHGNDAVAFAADGIFVSGPLPLVRSAIDCAAGKAPSVARSEWLEQLRGASRELHGRRSGAPAVELAVIVTPEIQQRIQSELGDGQDLRLFAARLDLRRSLDVAMVGTTGTRQQAEDMAARLTEAVRLVRSRKSMAALGLDVVLEHLQCSARGARVEGHLTVSEDQREVVGEKMKVVAQLIAQGAGTKAAVAEPEPK
jgi:hypothetical protein